MPRFLDQQRYFDRIRSRQARLGFGVQMSWQAGKNAGFTDYFPDVPGTLPEKMIFNWLAAKRINFYYNVYFGDIPFSTDKSERYRPDFLLPDYRIIIEPQGVYWHSRPGKFESDAVKFAMLEAAGYTVYTFSDTEILAGVELAMEKIPELRNPTVTGTNRIIGETQFNPTAPLVARIKARPKIVRTRFRGDKVPVRQVWQPERKARREVVFGPVFRKENLDPVYLKEIKQYGQDWLKYIDSLTQFFETYPEAADYYPEYYSYWIRWRNWWNRFPPFTQP